MTKSTVNTDNLGPIFDAESIASALNRAYATARPITAGQTAGYIPELAAVDPELFSVSVCTVNGHADERGDVDRFFTLQSVSKVLAYACALSNFDEAYLQKRVGVEASGEEFDSIIKLDRHRRPFNPMINAGAIAVTDLLLTKFGSDALATTMAFFADCLGSNELSIDEAVFQSEWDSGERNRAIAHLLKNFKLLDNPVDDVLALYFRHCSVRVRTSDMARLGALLANGGCQVDKSQRSVLNRECVRNILSVMLSCGMYNYAGQWIYEVGLPAKSGVSGGVVAAVPGVMGIAAWSPRVDDKGSSLRGAQAIKSLAAELNLHIFA